MLIVEKLSLMNTNSAYENVDKRIKMNKTIPEAITTMIVQISDMSLSDVYHYGNLVHYRAIK